MLNTLEKNLPHKIMEQATENSSEASGFTDDNIAFSAYCQDISGMDEFALAGKLAMYSASTGKRVQGFSEIHIAAYFAEVFTGLLYYVPEYNQFFTLRAGRYIPDARQSASLAMKALILSCIALSDSFSKFLTASKVASCLELVKSCPQIQRSADDFDKFGTVLNTPAGCYDLRTGQLAEYQPSMLQTGIAPDFDHDTPVWDAFLAGITKGDLRLAAYVAARLAYSLVYGNSEQTFTLCHGSGANGKGVLLGLMQYIFGGYAVSIQPEMLAVDKNGQARPSPELLQLRNKRLIVASETSQGMALNLQRIKALTGGDKVSARPLFSNVVSEFPVLGQIFLASNHLPALNVVDYAIRRRVKLLPFGATFDEKTRDEKMLDKLKAEAPAILGKLIRLAGAYLATGKLPECEAVQVASNTYLASEDKITAFLDSCTRKNEIGKTSSKELFTKYLDWCDEAGEQAVSQNKFGRTLTEKGFPISSDRRYRLGLELSDNPCTEPLAASPEPVASLQHELQVQPESSTITREPEPMNEVIEIYRGVPETENQSIEPMPAREPPKVSRRCLNCAKVKTCKQAAELQGAGCADFTEVEPIGLVQPAKKPSIDHEAAKREYERLTDEFVARSNAGRQPEPVVIGKPAMSLDSFFTERITEPKREPSVAELLRDVGLVSRDEKPVCETALDFAGGGLCRTCYKKTACPDGRSEKAECDQYENRAERERRIASEVNREMAARADYQKTATDLF